MLLWPDFYVVSAEHLAVFDMKFRFCKPTSSSTIMSKKEIHVYPAGHGEGQERRGEERGGERRSRRTRRRSRQYKNITTSTLTVATHVS